MAAIQYTAIVNEIRGKIKGTTFKNTKAGTVVQSNPRPLSKKDQVLSDNISASSKLTKADAGRTRNQIGVLANAWRGLTDAQRTQWNTSAINFPFTDRFGNAYTGSGFQVYMQKNMMLLNIGEATIPTPPAPSVITTPVFTTWTTNPAPGMNLTMPAAVPVGQNLEIFSNYPLSAGKGYSLAQFKQIGWLINADGNPVDLEQWYTGIFGFKPTAGNVWLKGRYVEQGTGNTSGWSAIQLTY